MKKLKEQDVKFKAKKIIDYPSFRQSTEYSCGGAEVQSALIYCFGSKYDKPESELNKQLKVSPKDGVDPKTIVSFLKSKGIKTEAETLTKEDLIKNINNNIPTILCIQAWGDTNNYEKIYKEGHYVTVIGYNNEGFIFEDPSISARYGFIEYDELDSRWHDVDKNGNKYDHIGIPIKCNKKYSPDKMEVIEGNTMKTVNAYLAYLTLRESEWDEETENPDSFDLQNFIDLIGDLEGVDKFKDMRHGTQPSLYHVYIKNALGDYMGRTGIRNNKAVPCMGFDQFKKDLPELKRRLKFVNKIKDKLPDHFYTKIGKGDNEPATGDAGGMG